VSLLRKLVVVLVLIGAVPFTFGAQSGGKPPRIGFIGEQGPKAPSVEAFRQGLRELGYVEGGNISVEYRFTYGVLDQVQTAVTELSRLKPDVLVVGGSVAARAAKAQSRTTPVVFATVGDPVGYGLVASLRRPGGNVTGLTNLVAEMGAKQLELLKELVPRAARVAVLYDPASSQESLRRAEEAARALGIDFRAFEVRKPDQVAIAFSALVTWRANAVLALSSPVLGNALVRLSTLSAVNRLPSIYLRKEFAEVGGLLTYGPDLSNSYRRAATYVDKILKGANPADLPVEQPTQFDLVVNLGTAQAYGIDVPQAILVRATRVIH